MSANPLHINGIGCSGCGMVFPSMLVFENPDNHRGACTGEKA